jgi:multiple sugar transport system permease protein
MLGHGNEVGTETLPTEFLGRKTFWETLASENYFKWLLIVPLLLILAIFTLYPMFYCLYYSFHEWGMVKAPVFFGLENYRDVLRDTEFWQALGRTFQVLVLSIVVELGIAMGVALLFNREFKGQNVIRGVILLPLLISPLAVSMMWNFFLQYDFGVINLTLTMLGFPKVLWFSPKWALYTIALISIWQWTPFSIFVLLAGLRSLPKDSFEAARVDGATPWYTFWRLTLPMLMPIIMIIILLRTMWLIRLFDPLYGTTRGGAGTELLDWQVYRETFVFFDIGRGSTLAIISLFLTIIVCAILFRQLMKALGATSH